MNRTATHLTLVLCAVLATGCATSNPDLVRRSEAQRLSVVNDAVVIAVRPVVVDGSQSGLGAAAGGAIGGIAGSHVGGVRESLVASVLGAVVGGVIGNAVERSSTQEDAVELLVQLRNGERRAIVQSRSAESFTPGDSVLLINQGGRVRVTRAPAPAVPPSAPAPKPA